jgi:ribosomal protein S14
LFNQQIKSEKAKLLLKSFLVDSWMNNPHSLRKDKNISDEIKRKNIKANKNTAGSETFFRAKLNKKVSLLNKKSSQSKPKNFCLVLGRGRTYNRKVFLSRQIFRKLVRYGLLSGIIK